MSFSIRHEDITPASAHRYLAASDGNRHLNQDYVLSLAVSMEMARWDDSASEIVFDENGVLVDGHHRLNAIITFGKPVRMLVKRGVAKSARNVIDTGRTRTIRDLFTMFRPGQGYVNEKRAALTTCIGLVMAGRTPPPLRTLDAYDTWMRVFADGIEAVLPILVPGGSRFRVGPILGALAFAHKTGPKRTEDFAKKVVEGLGLVKAEPATTLRNVILSPLTAKSQTGGARVRLARKTLNAIYADARGQQWGKAQDGIVGLTHFLKAYDSKSIEKLVSLWTPDAASEPVSVEN